MNRSSTHASSLLSPMQAGVLSRACAWGALALAIIGLTGSLLLSLAMALKACPLCFYQRTFMMSLVAVLGVGLVARVATPGRLCLMSLPLAVAGFSVALFHVWLEGNGTLECPPGLLGVGTAPHQSLAAFAALCVLLGLGAASEASTPLVTGAAACVLGVALAVASAVSNPPLPAPPQQPYPGPPDVCRPPFRAP
jgi:disulfide bond formation protein DsbB